MTQFTETKQNKNLCKAGKRHITQLIRGRFSPRLARIAACLFLVDQEVWPRLCQDDGVGEGVSRAGLRAKDS